MRLRSLTTEKVLGIVDGIAETPSEQLHFFLVAKTFLPFLHHQKAPGTKSARRTARTLKTYDLGSGTQRPRTEGGLVDRRPGQCAALADYSNLHFNGTAPR